MRKIVTKDLKNIKRHLTGEEKIITLGFKILTLSFLGFGLFASNSVFAETMKNKINIKPSMTLDIPVSSINLNLDPATKPFDSKDVNITVGTNNKTGYWISMSSATSGSDLVNIDDNTKTIPSITTAGSYTSLDFPINQWGYKIDSGNYTPFVSGVTIKSSSTTANGETFKLNIASKIDYLQPSGTYNIALNIKMLPNMIQEYMQDITPEMCTEDPSVVMDKRDGQTYTIARLKDGQCWMTSDLNLAGGTTLNASDSDVPTDNYFTLPASSATGFDDDTKAYVYNTGNEAISQADCTSTQACNSYYSWLAATAGGKDASGTAVTGNGEDAAYSICPKGWRLPKSGNNSDTSATSTTGYKKGDFYKLATAYGANLESSHVQNSAVFYNNAGPGTLSNFLLAGHFYSGSFYYGGTDGRYWSLSSGSSTNAYFLYFSGSRVGSAAMDSRRRGFSVRCILK